MLHFISVNNPEEVSMRYKFFCGGCEWKSHEPMPVSQEEGSSPNRERGRRSKRTNEIEGATLNAYILHLFQHFEDV